MADALTNSLQSIVNAINCKNYSWLEANSGLIHVLLELICRQINSAPTQIFGDMTYLHLNQLLKLEMLRFYNKMSSSNRIRLAPAFIKFQLFNAKARLHTMHLFMNAVIAMDINEIKFWHDTGLFAELINASDYTLKRHPIRVALAKDNKEVFEFLLHGGKCTIPELATNESKLRLLVDLLLKGTFGCADVLWTEVDPNERITLTATTVQDSKFSIIYLILFWNNSKAWYCGENRAQAVKWLLEKGLTGYDTEFPIRQSYMHNYHNPAFVVACEKNDPALVKVMLEYEAEKWRNNVGPVLEILPGGFFSCFVYSEPSEAEQIQNEAEISKILAMLLPLLNPDTKTVDLANALAAAILGESKSLENDLKALGADLGHVSKPNEYRFGKGRCFPARLKLLNINGELLLPPEDEETEFIVDRIAVNTQTVNYANLKKKMKNINQDSGVYFIHENFSFAESVDCDIKVWDRQTGRIYKGSPFIRSLFVGDGNYRAFHRRIVPVDDYHKNNYYDRYAIFLKLKDGSWRNGSRIMYKPAELTIGERAIEPVENKEAKNNEEAPRRSTRSKRTIEALETVEQPPNKRRKTAKK